VDGPFGAPAEHIFDFDHIMLIAAGIGVTPYASILKHVQHRLQNNNVGSLKKVYFYWVNRDEGSWEWFSDILTDLEGKVRKDFLEVHTYFTGALKADDIRNIVFSSSEVAKHAAATPVAAYARAMYAYAAQASDEMDLQEDDDVEVEVRNADGWWLGTNKKSGKKGLFPANYVQVIDKITKMEEGSHRHFGRPYWEDIFADVAKQVELVTPQRDEKRPKIGVFFCGPAVMSKQLYGFVGKANKKGRAFFDYKKENF
jgi:NADPH oxidase